MILLKNILLGKCFLVGLLVSKALNKVIQYIYAHAMQESVIHRIEAANSLSVYPIYHQFI